MAVLCKLAPSEHLIKQDQMQQEILNPDFRTWVAVDPLLINIPLLHFRSCSPVWRSGVKGSWECNTGVVVAVEYVKRVWSNLMSPHSNVAGEFGLILAPGICLITSCVSLIMMITLRGIRQVPFLWLPPDSWIFIHFPESYSWWPPFLVSPRSRKTVSQVSGYMSRLHTTSLEVSLAGHLSAISCRTIHLWLWFEHASW